MLRYHLGAVVVAVIPSAGVHDATMMFVTLCGMLAGTVAPMFIIRGCHSCRHDLNDWSAAAYRGMLWDAVGAVGMLPGGTAYAVG